MKLPAIVLMIAAIAAAPAVASARDHDGRGQDQHGQGAPEFGRGGGERPHGRPDGGYGPYYGAPIPPPGYRERGGYAPGGFGAPERYGGGASFRDRGDWNDFGPGRGGSSRWRRGQFFPPAFRGELLSDYYRYHLRRPPPGYYWYRSGDDYILAALASGLIFEVVPGDGE